MADSVNTGVTNPTFLMDEEGSQVSKATTEKNVGSSGVGGSGERSNLTKEEKMMKMSMIKNIVIISLAFTFLFTSYNTTAGLQSSLNKAAGTAGLTATYVTMVLSCCFLPSLVLQVLKEKCTMVVSMLCYSGYIAAQFYPRIYTLVPTAAILGIGAAPLWAAKCTYLTKVGTLYAQLTGEDNGVVITRFFGIFFLFFQSTNIWGNIISSTVLSIGVEKNDVPDEAALLTCGYNFCISESGESSASLTNVTSSINDTPTESELPSSWKIYTITSVFLACTFLSSLTTLFFVDPVTKFTHKEDQDTKRESVSQLVVSTFNHMRHPYQLLVIPLTIYSGLEQQFLTADYTAAYVTCALGVHMVGYVLISLGVSAAFFSVALTPLVKVVGRVPIFTFAFLINASLVVTFTYWKPHPDHMPWFFVISALWGAADAVWQTQINALYGVIFPGQSEAAFSNYRLWESIGFTIAYVCSTALCVSAKMTMLVVFMVAGILGYYVVEVLEKMGGLRRDTQGRVVPIDKLLIGNN
ncbi:protein unc-93 homolog A-like [Homarus americanus]|uniref:UNC93-like 4 n=1 Tax=Homarus americanus TaxID=6706 RepID=A0A8J5ML51_HOMAM|nr:protein unc-93 homolog A-like [Homarus americanus]KAG7155255.1 UNC93-like 4 [Homarus americanus]